MIFRQSAVTHLTRETCHEQWQSMPEDIQPVPIGSGEIAVTLDATGFQGLNSLMTHQSDTAPYDAPGYAIERNMHLYRDEALSSHYEAKEPVFPSEIESYSNMPLGWLACTITLDGQRFETMDLLQNASNWSRNWTPRSGIVVTEYTLGLVRLRWTTGIRKDAVTAEFQLEAESLDGRPHALDVEVKTVLTLRDGTPIFKSGLSNYEASGAFGKLAKVSSDTATAKVKVPLQVNWVWACEQAANPIETEESFGLRWSGEGESLAAGFRLIFGSDRDNTHSSEFITQQAREFQQQGVSAALCAVTKSWRDFFATSAEFHIGSAEKEFLAANCKYILVAGSHWHSGMPLGTLWTRKFGAGTFWDSFYAADGMLRNGHITPVRQLCDFLVRTASRKGRPHMWITWFDGSPATTPDGDKAYINSLAYASIGIRLYEVTRDLDDLRDRTYPYLEVITRYLLDEIFVKNAEGTWEMQGEISGDIGEESVAAKEQTDSLLWSVICLDKFSAYSEQLSIINEHVHTAREIAAHFRQHPVILNKTDAWYTWFPYICPAGGELADFTQWWDPDDSWLVKKFMLCPSGPQENHMIGTKDQLHYPLNPFIGTYLGMPWANFCVTNSFLVTGLPDLALEYQDGGLKYVSGMGYFTESSYESQTGGNSPYIPSCGAYLSSMGLFFAAGSLWNDDVDVAVNFPTLWRGQTIRWQNVQTINGAIVSGAYAPSACEYTIQTDRPRKLRLRIPNRIMGEPLSVQINGANTTTHGPEAILELQVEPGRHTVKIAADYESIHDTLVIDPFSEGALWRDLFAEEKQDTRWLHDWNHIARLKDQPRMIVFHQSYVAPANDVSQELLRRVQEGATLLMIYHAGVLGFNEPLAEASGVNAKLDAVWKWNGNAENCNLTPTGRQLIEGLNDEFMLYLVNDFEVRPAPDLEIIATCKRTGSPVITRRRHGKGWIWWSASGSKSMDRKETLGWGLHFSREMFVFGRNRDKLLSKKWLENPDFRTIVKNILHHSKPL